MEEKVIGIVAGAGPFAGINLIQKVCDQTVAERDQDHLTVIGWFQPNRILDRTEYLVGVVDENPAYAIAEQVKQMVAAGAEVCAIPCNTAHAPAIYDAIVAELVGLDVMFLHMIGEVARFLGDHYPDLQKVGVLATTGTVNAGIYNTVLGEAGYDVLVPNEKMQTELIHPAIYDLEYGVKATGGSERARRDLIAGISHLQARGAEAVILGCTEIPLVLTEREYAGILLIDPTLILARALIREACAEKLLPIGT